MPSIPKRTDWSSRSWARLAGALLGLLVILATGGCDGASGTGDNGGGGTAGTGGTGGIGGGGSGGTAVTRVWHEATLVEQDDVGNAQEPRLAGSRAGNAVVVWLHLVGDRNDVWANAYDPGTGWQTAQPIEQEDGDAEAPQVAVSPDGRKAMAVWSQYDDSTYWNVWVNRYEGLWRSEGTIINLDNGWLARDPQVVVYQGGSARVVWIESFRLERTVWANHYDLDWGWGDPEPIEADSGVPPYPELAMDPGGNAMAVWRQRDDTLEHYDIWANRWAPRP